MIHAFARDRDRDRVRPSLAMLLLAQVATMPAHTAIGADTTIASISAAIRQSVDANRRATTEAEWAALGPTADDIDQAARERLTAGAAHEACAVFASLDYREAEIFESSLREGGLAQLPCADAVIRAIEAGLDRELGPIETSSARARFRKMDLALSDPSGTGKRPRPRQVTQVRYIGAEAGELFHEGSSIVRQFGPGEIAITLDDGPSAQFTPVVLDILGARGIRANFFAVGQEAEKPAKSAIVRRAVREGHFVGSHSYTHPNDKGLRGLSRAQAKAEMLKGRAAVEKAAGQFTGFFRFPGGSWRQDIYDLLAATFRPDAYERMIDFRWNMDPADWRQGQDTYAKVVREIEREGRGILLLHDVKARTAHDLPRILDYLREHGHSTVVFAPRSLEPAKDAGAATDALL